MRFELRDGRAAKHWSIDRSGAEVVTAWGTIGGVTQSSARRFESRDLAVFRVAEQVARRRSSGWVRTSPARAGFAYDAALAARVRESFSDEAFAVYADFLLQAGDRRGELAVLELPAAEGDPAARERAAALRAELDLALVGQGAELLHERLHVEHRWGFPASAVFEGGAPESGATLRALLSDPAFSFLRELEVSCVEGDGETLVPALCEVKPAPPLARLSVKVACDLSSDLIMRLVARFPRLEALDLAASSCAIHSLEAPALTTLALHQLPALSHIAGLLAQSSLPALRHLTLGGEGSNGLHALLSSPLLGQLEQLDLCELYFHERVDVRAFASALAHVRAVRVDWEELRSALRAEGVRVDPI